MYYDASIAPDGRPSDDLADREHSGYNPYCLGVKVMKSILRKHQTDISLVIGNGINLYGPAKETNSWDGLLIKLWKKHLAEKLPKIPLGVSLTEFYDLLELKSGARPFGKPLQKEFCALMQNWKCHDHHKRIVAWAQKTNSPILTTNFERVLGDAGGCSLRRTQRHTVRTGFTDYYPWETYYGTESIEDPSQRFGIWHVNGMEHYHRSIRLGLTHYMGSVERARGWIHKGNERRLFSGKNVRNWRGAGTWLHIVFNSSLLIFGLGLNVNEVFLRWLLIERARYFRKFPDRKKAGWYVHTDDLENAGKAFFLEGVGIQMIKSNGHDEIYGSQTWN